MSTTIRNEVGAEEDNENSFSTTMRGCLPNRRDPRLAAALLLSSVSGGGLPPPQKLALMEGEGKNDPSQHHQERKPTPVPQRPASSSPSVSSSAVFRPSAVLAHRRLEGEGGEVPAAVPAPTCSSTNNNNCTKSNLKTPDCNSNNKKSSLALSRKRSSLAHRTNNNKKNASASSLLIIKAAGSRSSRMAQFLGGDGSASDGHNDDSGKSSCDNEDLFPVEGSNNDTVKCGPLAAAAAVPVAVASTRAAGRTAVSLDVASGFPPSKSSLPRRQQYSLGGASMLERIPEHYEVDEASSSDSSSLWVNDLFSCDSSLGEVVPESNHLGQGRGVNAQNRENIHPNTKASERFALLDGREDENVILADSGGEHEAEMVVVSNCAAAGAGRDHGHHQDHVQIMPAERFRVDDQQTQEEEETVIASNCTSTASCRQERRQLTGEENNDSSLLRFRASPFSMKTSSSTTSTTTRVAQQLMSKLTFLEQPETIFGRGPAPNAKKAHEEQQFNEESRQPLSKAASEKELRDKPPVDDSSDQAVLASAEENEENKMLIAKPRLNMFPSSSYASARHEQQNISKQSTTSSLAEKDLSLDVLVDIASPIQHEAPSDTGNNEETAYSPYDLSSPSSYVASADGKTSLDVLVDIASHIQTPTSSNPMGGSSRDDNCHASLPKAIAKFIETDSETKISGELLRVKTVRSKSADSASDIDQRPQGQDLKDSSSNDWSNKCLPGELQKHALATYKTVTGAASVIYSDQDRVASISPNGEDESTELTSALLEIKSGEPAEVSSAVIKMKSEESDKEGRCCAESEKACSLASTGPLGIQNGPALSANPSTKSTARKGLQANLLSPMKSRQSKGPLPHEESSIEKRTKVLVDRSRGDGSLENTDTVLGSRPQVSKLVARFNSGGCPLRTRTSSRSSVGRWNHARASGDPKKEPKHGFDPNLLASINSTQGLLEHQKDLTNSFGNKIHAWHGVETSMPTAPSKENKYETGMTGRNSKLAQVSPDIPQEEAGNEEVSKVSSKDLLARKGDCGSDAACSSSPQLPQHIPQARLCFLPHIDLIRDDDDANIEGKKEEPEEQAEPCLSPNDEGRRLNAKQRQRAAEQALFERLIAFAATSRPAGIVTNHKFRNPNVAHRGLQGSYSTRDEVPDNSSEKDLLNNVHYRLTQVDCQESLSENHKTRRVKPGEDKTRARSPNVLSPSNSSCHHDSSDDSPDECLANRPGALLHATKSHADSLCSGEKRSDSPGLEGAFGATAGGAAQTQSQELEGNPAASSQDELQRKSKNEQIEHQGIVASKIRQWSAGHAPANKSNIPIYKTASKIPIFRSAASTSKSSFAPQALPSAPKKSSNQRLPTPQSHPPSPSTVADLTVAIDARDQGSTRHNEEEDGSSCMSEGSVASRVAFFDNSAAPPTGRYIPPLTIRKRTVQRTYSGSFCSNTVASARDRNCVVTEPQQNDISSPMRRQPKRLIQSAAIISDPLPSAQQSEDEHQTPVSVGDANPDKDTEVNSVASTVLSRVAFFEQSSKSGRSFKVDKQEKPTRREVAIGSLEDALVGLSDRVVSLGTKWDQLCTEMTSQHTGSALPPDNSNCGTKENISAATTPAETTLPPSSSSDSDRQKREGNEAQQSHPTNTESAERLIAEAPGFQHGRTQSQDSSKNLVRTDCDTARFNPSTVGNVEERAACGKNSSIQTFKEAKNDQGNNSANAKSESSEDAGKEEHGSLTDTAPSEDASPRAQTIFEYPDEAAASMNDVHKPSEKSPANNSGCGGCLSPSKSDGGEELFHDSELPSAQKREHRSSSENGHPSGENKLKAILLHFETAKKGAKWEQGHGNEESMFPDEADQGNCDVVISGLGYDDDGTSVSSLFVDVIRENTTDFSEESGYEVESLMFGDSLSVVRAESDTENEPLNNCHLAVSKVTQKAVTIPFDINSNSSGDSSSIHQTKATARPVEKTLVALNEALTAGERLASVEDLSSDVSSVKDGWRKSANDRSRMNKPGLKSILRTGSGRRKPFAPGGQALSPNDLLTNGDQVVTKENIDALVGQLTYLMRKKDSGFDKMEEELLKIRLRIKKDVDVPTRGPRESIYFRSDQDLLEPTFVQTCCPDGEDCKAAAKSKTVKRVRFDFRSIDADRGLLYDGQQLLEHSSFLEALFGPPNNESEPADFLLSGDYSSGIFSFIPTFSLVGNAPISQELSKLMFSTEEYNDNNNSFDSAVSGSASFSESDEDESREETVSQNSREETISQNSRKETVSQNSREETVSHSIGTPSTAGSYNSRLSPTHSISIDFDDSEPGELTFDTSSSPDESVEIKFIEVSGDPMPGSGQDAAGGALIASSGLGSLFCMAGEPFGIDNVLESDEDTAEQVIRYHDQQQEFGGEKTPSGSANSSDSDESNMTKPLHSIDKEENESNNGSDSNNMEER